MENLSKLIELYNNLPATSQEELIAEAVKKVAASRTLLSTKVLHELFCDQPHQPNVAGHCDFYESAETELLWKQRAQKILQRLSLKDSEFVDVLKSCCNAMMPLKVKFKNPLPCLYAVIAFLTELDMADQLLPSIAEALDCVAEISTNEVSLLQLDYEQFDQHP